MKQKQKKKSMKPFLIILIILLLAVAGLLAYKFIGSDNEIANKIQEVVNGNVQNDQNLVELPAAKLKTYKGNERPIAVMIDNHDEARPQVSLQDAYIVYEIIVEGGYTRLMPIFKGANLDEIGPIRSARHYFLDYALENDAIYVHFGASPQALTDIDKYKVEAINGIYQSSSDFWRTSGKSSPHNVLASTKSIVSIAKSKNYRTTSTSKSVLNYTTDEVSLKNADSAIDVYVPFSTSENVSFKYDETKKVYVKYANNKKQVDWKTKVDLTTKNIIIEFAENYTLNDTEEKGRQGLNNVGTLDGYYITDGKSIKIKCEKTSRTSKTVYKDLEGNEIKINDGNTFVEICPLDAKVKIEGPEETSTNSNTVNN